MFSRAEALSILSFWASLGHTAAAHLLRANPRRWSRCQFHLNVSCSFVRVSFFLGQTWILGSVRGYPAFLRRSPAVAPVAIFPLCVPLPPSRPLPSNTLPQVTQFPPLALGKLVWAGLDDGWTLSKGGRGLHTAVVRVTIHLLPAFSVIAQ